MTKYIHDFYSQINLDEDAVDKMIATAKAPKPYRTFVKTALISAACAAVFVISLISVFLLRVVRTPELSYQNINRFRVSSTTETLIKHDGLTLRISGAYYNGERMIISLTGTLDETAHSFSEVPDKIVIAKDSMTFTVNKKSAGLVNNEIILKKNGDKYTGVMELNAPCEDSVVLLKGSIFSVDVYSDDRSIGKVKGLFELEETVSHVYTQSEAELLEGKSPLYIRNIAAFPRGAVNEPQMGMMMEYFIPDDFSDKRITATVINGDGSEIAVIQHYQSPVEEGVMHSLGFDFPNGRNVEIVFTDEDNKVVQEYQVQLNDTDDELIIMN